METQNGNEPTKNGPGRFGSSRFCFGGNAPLAYKNPRLYQIVYHEREGGGRYSHRTLKQAVALKAANVISAANNTELMKSAATGQRLTGDSPIVRPQLTASEPQAKTNITRGDTRAYGRVKCQTCPSGNTNHH